MRKVTNNAVNAFMNDKPFNGGNTTVELLPFGTVLKLHGHLIASRIEGKISITNAGWFSNTTKERLNGLDGVNIRQIKGVWYLNGKQWDGKPIDIC